MNTPILKQTLYSVGGVQYTSLADAKAALKKRTEERKYSSVVDRFSEDGKSDWSSAQLRCADALLRWLDSKKMYSPKPSPKKKAKPDAIPPAAKAKA
jgi:hypothetical protein